MARLRGADRFGDQGVLVAVEAGERARNRLFDGVGVDPPAAAGGGVVAGAPVARVVPVDQGLAVGAGAGFIDFLHVLVVSKAAAALGTARPKWSVPSPEDLREYADFQVIEAGRDLGLYNKTVMKALHGLLNKRNEAAHPSDYFPDMNETLGYVSEIFHRVERLK